MSKRTEQPRDQRIDDALDEASGKRNRPTLKQEWPLLIFLVLMWGALWQDFSAGNLIFGALLALLVVALFPLPPVVLSGRINLWYCFLLLGWFILQVVAASVEVAYLAFFRRKKTRSSIIAVRLHTDSDLIVTAVGHVLTLIPGSFVVEVDRRTSTLYLHYLNATNAIKVARSRAKIHEIERRVIMAIGSREEYEAVRKIRTEIVDRQRGRGETGEEQ
ncbi:Na+/H+ antiporter subunit E [Glutamicibacter sp. MNS18]|uniref:Na+/H+ antiporter subunit E n=1 Tax=Glutamicibacter sp. MNS18 TaxID=2989817 RepID=UPI002235DF6A|nr:Na+/H+ antiporter subunit E [Glutamicibacter sp. MNS18]MCW4463955.1 Na+/H+ antiporter subunit E [Glutamicibacter sp. MNS18]